MGNSVQKVVIEIESLMKKYLDSSKSYPKHPAYYDALVDVLNRVKEIEHGK